MSEQNNDKFDVLGAIVDRPTAEKFRQLCKPNSAEEVIETFIRNVISSNMIYEAYDEYAKGGD